MRLLRALMHLVLVLVLAVVTAAGAQARSVSAMPAVSSASSGHQGHDAAVSGSGHATHDHGSAAREQPVHDRDGCQTACCFTPGQTTAPPLDTTAIAFACVRYVLAVEASAGRVDAPEPGIPKREA